MSTTQLELLEQRALAARVKAQRTHASAHFAEAAALSRQALGQAPTGHPLRAALLNTLSGTLRLEYTVTGNVQALQEAIAASREAVADPQGAPYRGWCLCTLAIVLRLEFERTGEAGDLAAMEAAGREAVTATGEGHPQHGNALIILANTLLSHYQATGDVAAAREAALHAEQAAVASRQQAGARSNALHTVATARLALHRATSDDATLRAAVEAAEQALGSTPPEDTNQGPHASTLAFALLTSYGRSGHTAELRAAVRAARLATQAMPPRHILSPAVLHTLVSTLLELHLRGGEESDLTEAIETARRARNLTADTSLLPALHNALSMAMMMRYLTTRAPGALAEARAEATRACDVAGDDHPQRALFLSNLAKALRAEYESDPTPALLDQLVRTARQVAAETTPTGLHQADHLIEFVLALLHAHQHDGDPRVLREARDRADWITAMPHALPWQQVTAYRLLGRAEYALGEREKALHAYRSAIELLPRVAPQRLERMDREQGLGRIAGLGSEAASAATAAGVPETAVELLEQARGVLIEERLGARSQTARLADRHPELALEFETTRVLMDLPDERSHLPYAAPTTPAGGLTASPEAESGQIQRRRLALQRRWDELLARIRALNGFEDFLGRPSIAKLRLHATAGPVAIINSGLHGCDALILTDDPDRAVRVVSLPTVTERTVAQQAAALREELEDRQDISGVLGWAWNHVAQPVLSALGHTEPRPLDRRPRMWWCVTGPFAFLPLHAAGLHGREETRQQAGRTVMDRVISSYTPTVRALGHMKRSVPTPPDGPRGTLIVAMPQTPGETPLHGVEKEAKAIADIMPDTDILTGPQATREAVLTALPGHAVVHFACHGVSDAADPSASRLLLDDHRTSPLDVAAVSRLDLAHAELAYLSACSTTETTARFTDESVHITSAFLLAGFTGVVGTLWPVQDSAARRIAAAFYQQACAATSTTGPVDRAAYALHHAIDRMRAQRPGASALWSAHIHVGA
ncbi:CHAT domain-containing protein [Streptomyces europaeiscabiei]|uniref:CHAT domain-containing protein n=1 Tax=Streptomyces europaeiscabiei TaxID=146819 RepID=UPI0038F78FB0